MTYCKPHGKIPTSCLESNTYHLVWRMNISFITVFNYLHFTLIPILYSVFIYTEIYASRVVYVVCLFILFVSFNCELIRCSEPCSIAHQPSPDNVDRYLSIADSPALVISTVLPGNCLRKLNDVLRLWIVIVWYIMYTQNGWYVSSIISSSGSSCSS